MPLVPVMLLLLCDVISSSPSVQLLGLPVPESMSVYGGVSGSCFIGELFPTANNQE